MDPLTQAALGAAWAQPAGGRRAAVAASAVGAAAGMAPDADILIRSGSDPLLALEFHRHFTHSLSFIPLGALICSVLLWPVCRRWLTLRRCYLFSFLGFASHGLLDACTSYGTLLLWPFSDKRVAWDIVSVVDPALTGPLIVFLLLGVRLRRPTFALAGIGWCVAYLSLGAYQHQRGVSAATSLAASRAHETERLVVKPSFGNVLLWKSIYERDGRLYIDAIRLRPGVRVFPGESLLKLDLARDFPWLEPGTRQWDDVERFRRFADDFLAVDADNPLLIVDMRYSLLPNRGDGFWGIELDPAARPDTHVAYATMRDRPAAEGRELLEMLLR
jgi:inner membrane protein